MSGEVGLPYWNNGDPAGREDGMNESLEWKR